MHSPDAVRCLPAAAAVSYPALLADLYRLGRSVKPPPQAPADRVETVRLALLVAFSRCSDLAEAPTAAWVSRTT